MGFSGLLGRSGFRAWGGGGGCRGITRKGCVLKDGKFGDREAVEISGRPREGGGGQGGGVQSIGMIFKTHHACECCSQKGATPPQPPRFSKTWKPDSKHMNLLETHHVSSVFANGEV